ncbi:EAL domain-containing protein [Alicyclobacillus macrosporangiidus]|uniref:EAL domain, c-di-GMP-specific phosphodiesterase class I (Or its enzymatically inactive variant) n=1 Tax=Alicyclobacillus macrosporangiidus TaxID=392015 RepID=A0A1I7HFJ8_9BACL|nr:EAL domain-containing protein [Alicyclobacillus macrosporangiidus]SFU59497.1 EAL domain, c-di-GMP-specific phosphodiesterase class I (or its enzymatically inactive variant) [Alicyclobacillus macrosporangiidus]
MEKANGYIFNKSKITPPGGGGGYKSPTNPYNDNDVRRSVDEVLQHETLDVVYQPIVNHAEGVLFAHEALSRPRSGGQAILPDAWFRAAYACNRSAEADLLALTTSVRLLRALPHEIRSIPLFVNVMPSSLVQESFVEGIQYLFTEGLFDPRQLVIEIVEYISYDPGLLSKRMKPLTSLGVRIALDDVGAGNTSLMALLAFEPDYVKVDRAWVQGISTSCAKQRFLSRLVRFMESGNSVIAEGVDNDQDLAAIREAGVNVSQGYYWSRPLSVNDLSDLLGEIERKRAELVDCARRGNGSLTDEALLKKSQELDVLVNLYHRLLRRK